MAWLERYQLLVLGCAALLLVAGLLLRDITRENPPALVLRGPENPDGIVLVHVAGAVAAPGVYELQAGARVQDAVAAAGGEIEGADTGAINLARLLRDGEKIDVPWAEPGGAAAVPTLAPGEKLDINVATAAQLDQLPGIGEAYSQSIVDSRIVDGPYESVDDLVNRDVIPAATLERIRDRLTVGEP